MADSMELAADEVHQSLAQAVPETEAPFQTVYFRYFPNKYVKKAKATLETIYGGTILRCRIHQHAKTRTRKYAFVTFESPEVAARAVSGKYSWPEGDGIIQVKQADYWHQPDVVLHPIAHIPTSTRQPTVFDVLNTDCLHHIYQYLSPLDIARASEASQHLYEFASENIYHKHTKFNLFSHGVVVRTVRDEFKILKCLLQHYGKYITHCCLNASRLIRPTAAHIKTVLQNCPNLVQIRLQFFDLSANDLKSLMNVKMLVTDLQWINMGCSCNDDRATNLWKKWTSIRSLTIHGCLPGNSMRMLEAMHNLEKLSLVNCYDLEEPKFYSVLKENGATLKSLSLVDMKYSEQQLFEQLFLLAPNLVHLKVHISNQYMISRLHENKNLKHLQLIKKYQSCLLPTVYKPWNFEPFNQLEELDLVLCEPDMIASVGKVSSLRVLSIRQPDVTDYSALFDTVSTLPNLKRLLLSKCSGWSTEDTIKVLDLNHGLEEIELHFCSYSSPSILMLVECLNRQPPAGSTKRPTLRLTMIDDFEMFLDDHDRQLLQENRHLLRMHFENSRYLNNDEKEDGDDHIPSVEYFDPEFDDDFSDSMDSLDDDYDGYDDFDDYSDEFPDFEDMYIDGNLILNQIMFNM